MQGRLPLAVRVCAALVDFRSRLTNSPLEIVSLCSEVILAVNDEEAIGAVIDEMYAMISGPAGIRDWSRQKNCFHPDARQIRSWVDKQGRPLIKCMSLDDYARDTMPYFAANDFYEIETSRRIDLFGNIAQVWSRYEARRAPDDEEVERRGFNSIQLTRHAERGWRIIHMVWDNERD
jgi:hypothetical protein